MVQSVDSDNGDSRSRLRGFWIAAVVVGVLAIAAIAILVVQSASSPPTTQPTSTTTGEAKAMKYASVADMLTHQPFYVAHRGGSNDWPEMSMAAYENAARWGVGALEVSVARTTDGEFFGLHDRDLDRTSKVTGEVDPTTLTWAELTSRYKNKLNSSSPDGEPYTKTADVFEKFAANHVIFVDTKYIGDKAQRTDLINQMLSYAPAEHWVLKGYYDDKALTDLARANGIASWGYYYTRDLPQLDATANSWEMLGLEVEATAADWTKLASKDKPTIAFFIGDKRLEKQALAKGANGLMVSGVPATFGTPQLQR